MEEEMNHFMSHWFAGYIEGLISLDAEPQDVLLAACGQACADSYTTEQFRKAWENADGNLPRFLTGLDQIFPEAEYTLIDKNKIQVKYTRCACDLVKRGWVENPMQCLCSLHNLKANFEAAMGKKVNVELQETILGGDEQCLFLICVPVWGC